MEKGKLTDYEGTYERFLEKNEAEAEVMAAKEQKKKELDKSQIKAKSKVNRPWLPSLGFECINHLPPASVQCRQHVRAQRTVYAYAVLCCSTCVREELCPGLL